MNKAFEKILEILKEVPTEYRNEEYNNAIHDVIRYINRFAEEYNNGWIHCSERLPEENKTLIVWLSFTNNICSYVKRAIWFNNRFEYENGKAVSNIPVAWMQYRVPEPYQPNGE